MDRPGRAGAVAPAATGAGSAAWLVLSREGVTKQEGSWSVREPSPDMVESVRQQHLQVNKNSSNNGCIDISTAFLSMGGQP